MIPLEYGFIDIFEFFTLMLGEGVDIVIVFGYYVGLA